MPTRDSAWPQGTPNWVDLSVDDVGAAAAFYEGLFGWSGHDTGGSGGGYVMMSKGDRLVCGIGPKPQAEMPASWSTYFASDDADATAERVRCAGGQVHMDPFDVGAAGRMFVATAPDGATFGVWQAGESKGVGVYNEDGSLCWSELHSTDLPLAQAFFAEVFGFTYEGLDNPEFAYFLFRRRGEIVPVGGMSTNDMAPAGTPSHWLTWFASDDPDTACGRVEGLGGAILMAPTDTPFGRMAVVQGAQGESFGLIDLPASEQS